VYFPLLQQYVVGCVQTPWGTILSNNTYAIAYNYASSGGDKYRAQGLTQYDSIRSDACGSNVKSSTDKQNSDTQTLSAYNSTTASNSRNMALLQKCLVKAQYPKDPFFQNFTGYPNPFDEMATAGARNCSSYAIAPYLKLKAGQYNCTALPPCRQFCIAPQPQPIHLAARIAACNTEWLIHSSILRFGVTLLVFACINLSRMWFMDGLRRYHWRNLTPPTGFYYMGTVSRSGKMSKNMDTNLVKKVDETIVTFERAAYLCFFGAIAIHIPYIVVLAVMQTDLTYNQN